MIPLLDLGLCHYPDLVKTMLCSYNAKKNVLLMAHCHPCVTQGTRLVSGDIHPSCELVRYTSSRGGGATVHSPGQLLLFPVFPLSASGKTLKQWIQWFLKFQSTILETYGVVTKTLSDPEPGLWTENKKIGFVGLSLKGRWLTHGFSLNVVNDLSFFQQIRPCSQDIQVTSLFQELKTQNQSDKLWSEFLEVVKSLWAHDAKEFF
jgi:lipoate-protein ligase B